MKYRVRQGRGVSKMSFFIGIIFCFIGVAIFIFSVLMPGMQIFTAFSLVWMVICGLNTYRAYKNGFTEDTVMPLYEVDTEKSNEDDFESKIRKLDSLYKDGLINYDEFETAKQKILASVDN